MFVVLVVQLYKFHKLECLFFVDFVTCWTSSLNYFLNVKSFLFEVWFKAF